MSRGNSTAVLAVAMLLSTAAAAAAQACIGLPTRDGQIAVAGAYSRMDDLNAVGGQFHADVSGPFSLGFGYSREFGRSEALLDGVSGDVQIYDARASYELYLLDPSVCVVTGLWYMDNARPGVEERLGVPLGFGFGKTLRGPSASATLYALPQYVWLRQVDDVPDGDERVRTSNEFMGEAGVTFGFAPFYVGGAYLVSTVSDPDSRFMLRAGFIF